MDAYKIKLLQDFNKINLEGALLSQRDLYIDINRKINSFKKNKGLNIILLTGLRGTGKTTILKTIAKQQDVIYTSGDFLKLKNIGLDNISEFTRNFNKKIIIVDEILYLSNWQNLLKIEADSNQNILYIISGSSAVQLKEISQDLFRRLDLYVLKPLSFREFLKIKFNIVIKEDLNFNLFLEKDKNKLFLELLNFKDILPKEIFNYYNSYFENQLPFILGEENQKQKTLQLIEKVIYKDIPMISSLFSDNLKNIDLITRFLASSEKINYSNISRNLNLKKDLVIKIISLLEKAELLKVVSDLVPSRELRTNKKILFTAPVIRSSLNEINLDKVKGFSREDMFGLILSNLNINFAYNYKQNGFDYLVNNIKFEIGAKKKVKTDVISVGDFLDLKLENGCLIIPFYIFALINCI